MTQPEPIRGFDSQGEDYKRAFQVFLDHTDQKRNTKQLLQKLMEDLLARKVFIGAGNGEITRTFAGEQKEDRLLIKGAYRRKTGKILETDAIWFCHSGETTACEERHARAIGHSLTTNPYCS
ncbi:MAG TPA: hypothetical protein VK901_13525 [Nitrospiraceae bacterium]|nr:hypothetical protein [Nitrospiraceae bacterium]